jgi:hypothetical protein
MFKSSQRQFIPQIRKAHLLQAFRSNRLHRLDRSDKLQESHNYVEYCSKYNIIMLNIVANTI